MSLPTFIYLASASPRRRQLLDQIGLAHRPLLADATEDVEALEAERPGEVPADYVQRVTLAKLQAARRRRRRRGRPPAPLPGRRLLYTSGAAAQGSRVGPRGARVTIKKTNNRLASRLHQISQHC